MRVRNSMADDPNGTRRHERLEALGDQLRVKIASKFTASTFFAGFAFTIFAGAAVSQWQQAWLSAATPVAIALSAAATLLFVAAVASRRAHNANEVLGRAQSRTKESNPEPRRLANSQRPLGTSAAHAAVLAGVHRCRGALKCAIGWVVTSTSENVRSESCAIHVVPCHSCCTRSGYRLLESCAEACA